MAEKPNTKRVEKLFEPWAPPVLGLFDVASIQAVAEGVATADQQQHAMKVLIERLCGTYDEPFCPGEDGRRSTDYALGKRRIGLMLVTFIKAPLKNFKDDPNAPSEQG